MSKEDGSGPRARFVYNNPSSKVLLRKTIKLHAVSASVGVDYDVNKKLVEPKWQLDTSLGRAFDVQATAVGCTVSKNWDADLGAASCNIELRGHCTWSGRPTISIDVVPIHTVTKAVTGGVAFAVGKSLDINPRVKLGKLPVKLEVGASIYKEGAEPSDSGSKDDVLCLRIKSMNAIINL